MWYEVICAYYRAPPLCDTLVCRWRPVGCSKRRRHSSRQAALAQAKQHCPQMPAVANSCLQPAELQSRLQASGAVGLMPAAKWGLQSTD
jgi:hypothetical protein